MIAARRYVPTNFGWGNALYRYTYGLWLRQAYNVRAVGSELLRSLQPPFVLIGNHVSIMDPFITTALVPYPIHWVAADGNMRTQLMRFLLIKLAGCIPKSKAIPDIETVNWIVDIIRHRKGIVAFYPEGQSSWTGRSLPLFIGGPKLLRLLKAPVVLAKIKGGFLTLPRWSHVRRKGVLEVEFSLLFTPEELRTLRVEAIEDRIRHALDHDDTAWCRKEGIDFTHPQAAEYLELALHVCPSCGGLATLTSEGVHLSCTSCGFAVSFTPRASFLIEKSGTGALVAPFDSNNFLDNIAQWDQCQRDYCMSLFSRLQQEGSQAPLFSDDQVVLKQGKRIATMRHLLQGTMALYLDRLEFTGRDGSSIVFTIDDIEGEGVLKWNLFEFYKGMTAYRVEFASPRTSGRKYAEGISLLRTIHQAAN